ncbi:hypothetical protein, partial [Rhizobium leguminosarum]|uniref:hypothetical protein n=1 Tax=Rhizobium leguminosarum TaxID=384 RepID=UPI003F99B46A
HGCDGFDDGRAASTASAPAALILPPILTLIGLPLIGLCLLPAAIAAGRLLDELRAEPALMG